MWPDREKNAWMDRDWEAYPPRGLAEKIALRFKKVFADPLLKMREILLSMRGEPYYYYHRKYQRVPTIDQCWDYDNVCHYEADQQMKRDKSVEEFIYKIIQQRYDDCVIYEGYEKEKCRPLLDMMDEAATNYFIKYGDLGMEPKAEQVFMKQKHRMAWERRHGPVGTGMRKKHMRNDGSFYYE